MANSRNYRQSDVEIGLSSYPAFASGFDGFSNAEPCGQTIQRDRSPLKDDHKPTTCLFFLIFKRMISAFFIVGDKILDWSQFAGMNDVTTGTTTETTKNATKETFDVELPDIEASWETVIEFGNFFKGGGIDCDSGTKLLTILYGITCFLGSVYALFQLVNMVGETVKECNYKCWKGYQLIHGWVETLGSLYFEEIPQTILILFFSGSCRKDSIMFVKSIVTAILGYMKNNTRKSTCKQKKKCCENCCDWQWKLGCLTCCPCYVCYAWTWCQPCKNENNDDGKDDEDCMNCCKFGKREWAVAIDIPCTCTCVTWTLCGNKGLCENETYIRESDGKTKNYRKCCKCRNRCKNFLGDIDKDPEWAERAFNYGSFIHFVGIVVVIVNQVFGFSILVPSDLM